MYESMSTFLVELVVLELRGSILDKEYALICLISTLMVGFCFCFSMDNLSKDKQFVKWAIHYVKDIRSGAYNMPFKIPFVMKCPKCE